MPKILANLDLSKNQLLNATIQNLATAPANPVQGLFYYNTVSKRVFYYNGTAWIGADSADASFATFSNISDGVNSAIPDFAGDMLTFGQNGGLTVQVVPATDTVLYSHADTSNAANVVATDRTYIKSLTFDTYGHVTAHSVGTETITDTTYTAGTGLGLTGTVFSHADTSSLTGQQGSTGISSVTVDALGHVTAVGTANYSLSDHTHGQLHTQNTDTGTTSSSFQLDNDAAGVRISNNGGTELQIRNAADNGFADLRVFNLTVDGTQTIINSNIVSIGDNEIELNSDINAFAQNSDGGLTVKRLKADNTTRADAKITYNNSTNRWTTTTGIVSDTLTTATIANKVVATVGDGNNASFVITHNLNTQDLIVSLRDNNSPYEVVITDIEMTTVNTLTITFAEIPASGRYNLTIIG